MVLEGPKSKRLQSCSREIGKVEVRVVNEGGIDVAPGEVGKVITRGNCLMKGHWNLPQVTVETLSDGYLYTGPWLLMKRSISIL